MGPNGVMCVREFHAQRDAVMISRKLEGTITRVPVVIGPMSRPNLVLNVTTSVANGADEVPEADVMIA